MCGTKMSSEGVRDARGGDGLADVALGVLGAVHDEAADGCGQALASDSAGLLEGEGRQVDNALHGRLDAFLELLEDGAGGGAGEGLSSAARAASCASESWRPSA